MKNQDEMDRGSERSLVKPEVVKIIKSVSVQPGESAYFEIQYSQKPGIVQWFKNNTLLNDTMADRFNIFEAPLHSYRLQIMHCREEDSGIYSVRAMNTSEATTCSAQLVVRPTSYNEETVTQKAPAFLISLKDSEILKHSLHRLLIKVLGDPTPTIEFLKDGTNVLEEDGRIQIVREKDYLGYYELVIHDVMDEDQGVYVCRAENKYGEVQCQAKLKVCDERNIFGSLSGQLLSNGETPHFEWKRNNNAFDPDERFKVLFNEDEDSLALVFTHVKPEDAGIYTCAAKTSTGNISCSAELSVLGSIQTLHRDPQKPLLQIEHKEAKSSLGGSAILEMKCKGYPKPTLEWIFDGKLIETSEKFKFLFEDEESISLLVKDVSESDAGEYKIVASNDLGTDTSSINLYVNAAPSIEPIQDLKCLAGDEVFIKTVVSGFPKPNWNITLNGKPLTESKNVTVKVESNISGQESIFIKILDIQKQNSGQYVLFAMNDICQVTEIWNCAVFSKPTILRHLEDEYICSEGDHPVLSVLYNASPAADIHWYKNGIELEENTKYLFYHEEGTVTLKIMEISRFDTGSYSVEAKNEHGIVSSKTNVFVRCAPDIYVQLSDKELFEHDSDVELSLQMVSYPTAKIKWYLDGIEIDEKRTEFRKVADENNIKLILKDAIPALQGNYSCRITNEYGTCESECAVIINCKPRFRRLLKNIEVLEGDSLQLDAEVDGHPKPKTVWFKDEQDLSMTDRYKIFNDTRNINTTCLSVENCLKLDSGHYKVTACNLWGSISSVSNVIICGGPVITNADIFDRVSYETLPLIYEVHASGVPKPVAEWYHDDHIIKADDRISMYSEKDKYILEVSSMILSDAGEYKLVLKNKFGEVYRKGILSLSGVAEYRKPKLRKELYDVTSQHGASLQCCVVVIADPTSDLVWLKDGKPLSSSADTQMHTEKKKLQCGLEEISCFLNFSSTQFKDTGRYEFRATNKYGDCSSCCWIDVLSKPKILQVSDKTCMPFETVYFDAIIEGNPKPKVTWTKGNENLSSNENCEVIADVDNCNYRLIIKSADPSQSGPITLSAINNEGMASVELSLNIVVEVPYFLEPPKDMEVHDLQCVHIKVVAHGIPQPKLIWYANDNELPVSGDESNYQIRCGTVIGGPVQGELILTKFQTNDIGQYRVAAKNDIGIVEAPFSLKLFAGEPRITQEFSKALDVKNGDSFTLQCVVDGSPMPDIQWFKDGVFLSLNERVKQEALDGGILRLDVANSTPKDSGAYKLVLSNAHGEKSLTCAVSIKPENQKPRFIKRPQSADVKLGDPLFLEAQLYGFPCPEVKWFKDGVPLRQDARLCIDNKPNGFICLRIEETLSSDSGCYVCKAENMEGEAESDATINISMVHTKPVFKIDLCDLEAPHDFPIQMRVEVMGVPTPVVNWFHNGADITNKTKKYQEKSDELVVALQIDHVQYENSGLYEVKATNTEGTTSSLAKLNVIPRSDETSPEQGPRFTSSLIDLSIDEGKELQINAFFESNPIPEVFWSKDKVPLEQDRRVFYTCVNKKASLSIYPAEQTDTGVYTCFLVNPLGEDLLSCNACVKKVYKKPIFTKRIEDQNAVFGEDTTITVSVSGVPYPTIKWYFKEKPIQNDVDYLLLHDGDTQSLAIKDCQAEKSGMYKCIASNCEGNAFTQGLLYIGDSMKRGLRTERPLFLTKVEDCGVKPGMSAIFSAHIRGYPAPDVEWLKNDDILSPSVKIQMASDRQGFVRLEIIDADPTDCGLYTCRIFNSFGEDICNAELFVEDNISPNSLGLLEFRNTHRKDKFMKPAALAEKPMIASIHDNSLKLSWQPPIPTVSCYPVTYQIEYMTIPNGTWQVFRTGIRNCEAEIQCLQPQQDYRFRVRVENAHGISEPSPYVATNLKLLLPDRKPMFAYLPQEEDFRPYSSPFLPSDFDIERPPLDGLSTHPEFVHRDTEVYFGIPGKSAELKWFAYGYPKPNLSFYCGSTEIIRGKKYDYGFSRNGQATLFIERISTEDAGIYEAVARNENGEARQRVKLEIAEFPSIEKHLKETCILVNKSGRLEAQIIGRPYPKITWFKDWEPITSNKRVKTAYFHPDISILYINEAMSKDNGLYSVVATNIAGTVISSARVFIEDQENKYLRKSFGMHPFVRARNVGCEEKYDFGDQLGHGSLGPTYHVVERCTGANYAAKVMPARSDIPQFVTNSINSLNALSHRNLITLHDAYDTDNHFVLITELAAGGELVRENIIRYPYYTEIEIVSYIKQVLCGLEHMHDAGIGHMGLTIKNLLISVAGGNCLKINDFSVSRKVIANNLETLDYGVLEFLCPEAVNMQKVGFGQDLWSVGIITYILLSGHSPFRGLDDLETLENIRSGRWEFKEEVWKHISSDGKDFIRQLLQYKPQDRLTIKEALKHPWVSIQRNHNALPYKLHSASLRKYLDRFSGRRTKRIYHQEYSCNSQRSSICNMKLYKSDDDKIFQSESRYQQGPDTYLLQLRDVDFPIRLREYMKLAHRRSPSFASNESVDLSLPIIRERRRFTDIMDEEIDDERMQSKSKTHYKNGIGSLKRLKSELGPRLHEYADADAFIQGQRNGCPPFFREKPQTLSIVENQASQIFCLAVGNPEPSVQWFKNDMLLKMTKRLKILSDDDGRTILRFDPALSVDTGVYKCVARNKIGQTVSKCVVLIGNVPDAPECLKSSQETSTEVLLTWTQFTEESDTPVLCYCLQLKSPESSSWITIADNIVHEFFLVRKLEPASEYFFRLASKNRIGWSPMCSPIQIKTLESTESPIQISHEMIAKQALTESGKLVIAEEVHVNADYNCETNPPDWLTDSSLTASHILCSEIYRGQFCVISEVLDKSTNNIFAAKIFEFNDSTSSNINSEFRIFRSLRHTNIPALYSANKLSALSIALFVMEKLTGDNILTYFESCHQYSEEMVSYVLIQTLDALQYLHWRGICHLNIQPDNLVMKSSRSLQVKLIDFGSAKRITKSGDMAQPIGLLDFQSPEMVNEEYVFPQSDVWSVGVLAYILLSGCSPFRGKDDNETQQNISFVRYRFENLYNEVSPEATRFLMFIFKRHPTRRPSTEDCLQHRWLEPSEYMIQKRRRGKFQGNGLQAFLEDYTRLKAKDKKFLRKLEELLKNDALKDQ